MTIKRQLRMVWPVERICQPPEIVVPDGYRLRAYAPGDEKGYVRVMQSAGFNSFLTKTVKSVLTKSLPDGLFFVVTDPGDKIVATTVATHNPTSFDPFGGELGWVAVSPDHTGKHLGTTACAAVVRRFLQGGYQRIYLLTDDNRLPAIKTYLKMGFVPHIYEHDMEERWQSVCRALQWAFTPKQWPYTPSATWMQPPVEPERDNADRMSRYQARRLWQPARPHKGLVQMGDVDAMGDESLYHPSRLGSAGIAPAVIQAGTRSPFTFTFRAGPTGLAAGTSVTYAIRGQSPLGRGMPAFGSARSPATVEVQLLSRGFKIIKGALREGDEVVCCMESFIWTPLAGRREIKVCINSGGDLPQQRLPEPLCIDILPLAPVALEALLPMTHRPAETANLNITVRDRFDNRVELSTCLEVDGLGRIPLVDGRAVASLTLPSAGPGYINVVCHDPALKVRTNPSISGDALQCYIGDLHSHDFLSEAEGYPDEVYRFAREDRHLDFLSVVPQSHGWHDNETWMLTKYMNERWLDEGRFVTFLGFEWQHTGYGDKVIHYLGGDQPYLPVDDARYDSARKLYVALRDSDALVIGHHPCYPAGSWCSSTDFDYVETDVERLVELWSMHGSSEGYDSADRPLKSYDLKRQVMAALRNGLRLGFVAGSDTHSGRPGGSMKEPRSHFGGLTAVWAAACTRRDIYHALFNRHTYALTRARIVMKMTVNGAIMGTELPLCKTVHVRVDVWAPAPVVKIELLKNTKLLHTVALADEECHVEYEDAPQGPAFYHARVTLADGNLAVCSPVWIG